MIFKPCTFGEALAMAHENARKVFEEKEQARIDEIDNRINFFRSAVFELGLEPKDYDVQKFMQCLSEVDLHEHKLVYDTLRSGWEIISSSDEVSKQMKKQLDFH